ncbi:T-lymphocyte surface antigen Ly-9-like isoform X2 [Anguilla rostrata]|uniref:T-lymphocyte surface antigen Ly-9-like isoform X2 n=1 Tax=Anguilla rostrata TaxID=7938 RepID=UPI0030D41D7D
MRAAVILLYICLIGGVCVSSVQSNMLNGIVGQTVTFPSVVKEIGFILKNGSGIAKVVNRILQLTNGSYGTRLQWNSSTGLFSLTDLRRGDSGGYRVQHKDGKTDDYQLVVWDPVPRPQVSSRNKMKPGCSVLCSVENGREVTLSWHREGQTLSHTSSPNFSSPLSVPLEIETNSAPYSCVATNPVSNKTVTVRPEEHCFGVRVSSVQSNMLNGIVGQTVMFPAAVKEIDYIVKDGSVIAKVVNQTIQLTNGSYGTRLQWNSSTGLFSLTDLRRGDSGGYSVQHKDGTAAYQLVVWDPVPRPQVSSRNKMKPNCSVLCSVENGREVTLSWHREGQTLSHTSSPNFSSPLSLPLEMEENSAPYSCVATNPVSNKAVTVRPEEHCFGVRVSSVQSNMLNGIVGQTVMFPAAVKEINYIFKDDSVIAKVVNQTIQLIKDSYGTRLQWNSSTGLFSLSDLRKGDSGGYRVQHKDGKTDDYQLVVWDPVPRPQVSSRNKMKPNCSVLCSVKNGREVTLSWHREGQTLSHTSSPNFSSPLSLPLEMEENSTPYSCVATNPVSNKTVTVRPEEHCFESVSKPHITSVAEGGRSCSLQCSVQNGREVTLSWRTEGQRLSQTSSLSLSTLSLTLEIEVSNFTYTCVAINPGSEEKTAFHPTQVCRPKGHGSHDALLYIMFVLRLVEFVLVTLAVGLLIHQYRKGRILTLPSTERRRRRRSSETVTEL